MFFKKFNEYGHITSTETWLKNREFNKLTKNWKYINDCHFIDFWNQLEEELNKNPDDYKDSIQ
jgi:hypothetical protein